MSGVKMVWHNGDLNDMVTRLVAKKEHMMDYLEGEMRMTMAEAEDKMRQIIEQAVTPTGARRAARQGGVAGRIDTGNMWSKVRSSVRRDGDTIIGEFGWLDGLSDDELYFLYQENGASPGGHDIEPMHALLQSYIEAREDFIARIASREGLL